MRETAAWWRCRARWLIERVLREHTGSAPVRIRRELRATFRAHRRKVAPRYTRAIWYEQARAAVRSRLRDMVDDRQLALFP